MYIKQIIIDGFKSYGQRTVVESFHPGHNVVVGRNGSGKSNFFFAIQFVLSDEFTNLQVNQRQALLYTGIGPRVISASVEIIFDNSDKRLLVDKDTVSLKRVIGLKKDQYLLNKKVITRGEVTNLLESAGFSRSNPYYIVKQGKINEMAKAPDTRLQLLQEIAGLRVYEDRKKESLKILEDTQIKLGKIQERLTTIEERLETLKNEMQELKEYKKLDKEFRSIEHIIHERFLIESKDKLKFFESKHEKCSAIQARLVTQLEQVQTEVKNTSTELKKTQKELQNNGEQTDLLKDEQEKLLKEKIELELTIKDLNEEIIKNNDDVKQIGQELENLKIDISERELKLQNIKPEYENIVSGEAEIKRELDLKHQKRKELFNKEGRGAQFNSKEERDAWIDKELKQLNKQIDDKRKHEKNIKKGLNEDEEKRATLEKKIEESTIETQRQKNSIDDLSKKSFELKKQRDDFLAHRNDLYRQDKNLQNQLLILKEDLLKVDQNLRSMFGRSMIDGRNSIQKVLDMFSDDPNMIAELSKYYGLVIENFECDPQLFKAVEVTAGNRLFYHIVETNELANKILKEMNKHKLPGEVTIMPLDRLNTQSIPKYPTSSDAFSLISKLTFDNKFHVPLRNIFGRILVCRNLEIAAKFSRHYHLDCVTIDGDQAASKGWLKGGCFNNQRSAMKTQNERNNIINQISDIEQNLDILRKEIRDLDHKINLCISEEQRIETKIIYARDIYDKVKNEINMMKKEINNVDDHIVEKEKSLRKHELSLETMLATKESLENEKLQDLVKELSVADQQEINYLNTSIKQLSEELKQVYSKRTELEMEKNEIENLLAHNLILKKDRLTQDIQEILMQNKQQLLDASIAKLSSVENRISEIKKEIKVRKNEDSVAIEKQKVKKLDLEGLQAKESQMQKQMEENNKELETLTSKIYILQKNVENSNQKISELAIMPNNELYSKYAQTSIKQLFKKLEETKQQLKKYDHVNKKALDQFSVFNDQKINLFKRKEELDKGYEKIQELMDVLHRKKCEAIEFTFKQVSKYFTEVFSKLVPNGKALLVMKKPNDTNSVLETSVDSDRFIGIDIKVSFTGQKNEIREMKQLSGGQKSLMALTLIFAIQKCDPAPFYLFDEIDQALDTEHRKAVGEMIHELSSEAQFITTTFRPELLQHANKFYGVTFRNQMSFIDCVNHEDATKFLEAND